jgi:uncharacterized membrane protein YiaA
MNKRIGCKIMVNMKYIFQKLNYRNYYLVVIVYMIITGLITHINLDDKISSSTIFTIMVLSSIIINISSVFTLFLKGKEIIKRERILIIIFILHTLFIQYFYFKTR